MARARDAARLRDHRAAARAARGTAPAPLHGRRGAPRHAVRVLLRRAARRRQHQEGRRGAALRRAADRPARAALADERAERRRPRRQARRRGGRRARPRRAAAPLPRRGQGREAAVAAHDHQRRSRCGSTSPATPWTRCSARLSSISARRPGWCKGKNDYHVSSGLSRPDFFDWPQRLVDEIVDFRPDAAAVLFGANDGQDVMYQGKVLKVGTRGVAGRVRAAGGRGDGHPHQGRPPRLLGRAIRSCVTSAIASASR